MTFKLNTPTLDDGTCEVSLEAGDRLFVLGPNGTGKSSLMHLFYKSHRNSAHRITAHRQTWFLSNAVTLSPHQKNQAADNIKNKDSLEEARWKDDYSAQRASIAIYDLIDAENVRARQIAGAVDNDDIDLARSLSGKSAPIQVINKLLRLSNLPIEVLIEKNASVMAKRHGGEPYSIAELSDGERNAILIASTVLTAEPGRLLLIDEPERHLHRSIISPLLTLLFSERSDCAFVVSTHEVLLPLDDPESKVLLVRNCNFSNRRPDNWVVDLLEDASTIDEGTKTEILGERRKMLFVEGEDRSLDKPLYSLVFPDVSVIPKSNCKAVETAVAGIRGAENLHWLRAYGIVDRDNRDAEDIQRLAQGGVYALPVYSVESIYYHTAMMLRIANRHAEVTGENASDKLRQATDAAIRAAEDHLQRLAERRAEQKVRKEVFRHLPNARAITEGHPVNIQVDVQQIVSEEVSKIRDLVITQNLDGLLQRYPLRETPALHRIVAALGFASRSQYESSVRQLLIDNSEVLAFIRELFGDLSTELEASS